MIAIVAQPNAVVDEIRRCCGLMVRQPTGGGLGRKPLSGAVIRKLGEFIGRARRDFAGIDLFLDIVGQAQERQGPAHGRGRHPKGLGDLLAIPAIELHQAGECPGLLDGFEVFAEQVFDQLLFEDLGRIERLLLEVAIDRGLAIEFAVDDSLASVVLPDPAKKGG